MKKALFFITFTLIASMPNANKCMQFMRNLFPYTLNRFSLDAIKEFGKNIGKAKQVLEHNPHVLIEACLNDDMAAVRLLLMVGAPVEDTLDNEMMPLHWAVHKGNYEISTSDYRHY